MNPALDPLSRLAISHGTDKWGPHFYTPVYHALLRHLRDRPIRLLEIGVGGYGWKTVGGASLAMWAEYFPRGHIVGFDIEAKQLDLGPRVTLRQGSQHDAALLARLTDECGPFDVIIDDGSHLPAHVTASFAALFPRMADQGLYIIEDVQTCFWPQFGGRLADGGATMQLASQLLRYINHAEVKVAAPTEAIPQIARQVRSLRAYHNLLIVEKGDNSEPSNFGPDPGNPHSVQALRVIEHELQRSPTAAGLANLAMTLLRSGNRPRATALVDDGLKKWPNSPALLVAAIDILTDKQRRLALLDRLAQLEPPASSPLIERTRMAIREENDPFFCATVIASNSRAPPR